MSVMARWSLRNIYLYLVCLITLIMVIVALVGLVRDAVEIIYPDPGGYYYDRAPVVEEGDEVDEEVAEEQQEQFRASERRRNVINLVGNIAMLFVAGPIYAYHWRKIETEPESTPTSRPS